MDWLLCSTFQLYMCTQSTLYSVHTSAFHTKECAHLKNTKTIHLYLYKWHNFPSIAMKHFPSIEEICVSTVMWYTSMLNKQWRQYSVSWEDKKHDFMQRRADSHMRCKVENMAAPMKLCSNLWIATVQLQMSSVLYKHTLTQVFVQNAVFPMKMNNTEVMLKNECMKIE